MPENCALNTYWFYAGVIRFTAANNSTGLRRILVRLQGASAGAYWLYVPVDVTL